MVQFRVFTEHLKRVKLGNWMTAPAVTQKSRRGGCDCDMPNQVVRSIRRDGIVPIWMCIICQTIWYDRSDQVQFACLTVNTTIWKRLCLQLMAQRISDAVTMSDIPFVYFNLQRISAHTQNRMWENFQPNCHVIRFNCNGNPFHFASKPRIVVYERLFVRL